MLQRSLVRPFDRFDAPAVRPRSAVSRDSEGDALSTTLDAIKRNFRLVILMTVIGTALAVVVVFSMTPQYKATTEVLIDPRKTEVLKDRQIVDSPLAMPGTDTSVTESEVEMLHSQMLLRKVAQQLDLLHDDEFASGGVIGAIKTIVLAPLRALFGSAQDDDPLGAIVDALQKKVDAKRRNTTYVIDVSAWSASAAKSARLANAIADTYLAEQIGAKQAVARRANGWLDERVLDIRKRLTESEQVYERYKAENGLFDPGGESLSDRQVQQLNDQLVQQRAVAAQARAKYEQLAHITPDKLQSAAASPDVLQSTVIANLRGQYADAAKREAELVTRYGSLHPQVEVVRAQLHDLSGQITAEISRIVKSARTEFEMARSRQASLEASLDELKQRAAQFNQASVRLRELDAEVQANRSLYETVLSRAKETAAQTDMQVPDARIVSKATVPVKVASPQKTMIISLAFAASFSLGIGIALARDVLDRGFRRLDDVATIFGVPPIASIPMVGSQRHQPLRSAMSRFDLRRLPGSLLRGNDNERATLPDRIAITRRMSDLVLTAPESHFADSIRSLRVALKRVAATSDSRIFLITSALPGEGKSTVATNVALSAAAAGDHVLLIDADLRRPSVARSLGIGSRGGLPQVLAGGDGLQRALQQDRRTGLYVIAGQQRVAASDSLTLLSSESLDDLFALARSRFDLVIVDAAPLLPVAEARMMVDRVDGVVVVVASEHASRDAVAAAFNETHGIEEKLAGVVFNKSANEFDRYHYYYGDDDSGSTRSEYGVNREGRGDGQSAGEAL